MSHEGDAGHDDLCGVCVCCEVGWSWGWCVVAGSIWIGVCAGGRVSLPTWMTIKSAHGYSLAGTLQNPNILRVDPGGAV